MSLTKALLRYKQGIPHLLFSGLAGCEFLSERVVFIKPAPRFPLIALFQSSPKLPKQALNVVVVTCHALGRSLTVLQILLALGKKLAQFVAFFQYFDQMLEAKLHLLSVLVAFFLYFSQLLLQLNVLLVPLHTLKRKVGTVD